MGTSSMISRTVGYGTRACTHTRAGIYIRLIHGYLDTHGYPRVPIDFLIDFCTKKNTFLITYKLQFLNIHT